VQGKNNSKSDPTEKTSKPNNQLNAQADKIKTFTSTKERKQAKTKFGKLFICYTKHNVPCHLAPTQT
jgi:TorA maturation chaperone TorD